MKTTFITRAGAIVLGAMTLLFVGVANAAHPASVAGNWSATSNQAIGTSNLTIFQAASAAVCKPITGSIFNSPIEGYYCPVTGRIVFARFFNGVPFQLHEGYVARDAAVDRIGGSVMIWNANGGGLANEGVDFNFSATK